jgi:hypothetical protein
MTQRLLSFFSRTEVWVGALALAAFLILFWVLRGAPIGQSPREEEDADEGPGAGYRDRVVAAMVTGLLLVMAGAYIALTRSVSWSLPVFALGFGLVLALVAFNRRYRHTSPTLRRTIELSDAALTAALLAGILIVANVLAFRYGGQPIDLTRERAYSLSSQSLNLLKDLKRNVTFTAFFGNSPLATLQRDRVRQLLELYKAANPKMVRVEYVDPFDSRDVDRIDALKKRVPDVVMTEGGGIVVEYGEGETAERGIVANRDLFTIARPGANFDRFESSFKGEDAVTTTLTRLREGKRSKVVFTTGHGEPLTTEADPRRTGAGLGVWSARLSATGSEALPLSLIRDEIPADASLVVVAAPKTKFKPEEVSRLKAFTDKGGPVLLVLNGTQETGLEDFLKSFNIAFGPGEIVDPRLCFGGRPQLVVAPVLGQIRHPIVDSLINRGVIVPSASPIEILQPSQGNPVNPSLVPTTLLRTSRESWAETELPIRRIERNDKDRSGPLNVAVAVAERGESRSGQPGKARLVLVSSPMVGDNYFVSVEPTNLDFLTNSIHWLRGRSEQGGISPKTHTALTLAVDPILRTRLVLVPTVMAIMLIIGLGITTFAARRE